MAESLEATIRINVTNTAPVADDLSIFVSRDVPQILTLICEGSCPDGAYDPDGDSLSTQVISHPEHGRLEELGSYLVYYPDATWRYEDSFEYKVHDGIGASETKTVFLMAMNPAVANLPVQGALRITAYRPKHTIFLDVAVPANQPVGVRWNNDNDKDNQGLAKHDRDDEEVANKDGLVKLELDFGTNNAAQAPAGVTYQLKMDNDNIRMWLGGPDKRPTFTAVLGPGARENTLSYPVGVTPGKVTIWVEWIVAPDVAQAQNQNRTVLTFEAYQGNVKIHETSVELFGFQGMLFVFGGRGQKPSWPIDREHGIFHLAYNLYHPAEGKGFDVYLSEHHDKKGTLAEAKKGIGQSGVGSRGVKYLAVMGYSYSGSMTYGFSRAVVGQQGNLYSFQIPFTAHIDAVRWATEWKFFPERQRSPSIHHVNYY